MPDFRAYLLDRDGRIFAREEVAADNLEAAKNRAFQILRSKGDRAFGIEIWSGRRRLFHEPMIPPRRERLRDKFTRGAQRQFGGML